MPNRQVKCDGHTHSSKVITADTIVGELLTFPRPNFSDSSSPIPSRFTLARREISDIKFQLAQNDPEVSQSHDVSQPLEKLETSALVRSMTDRTDLIPGVYEGGLKTWECSLDLVDYLSRTFNGSSPDLTITDQTVLEIGCGAALPGIYCLLHGAARVDLQDYNPAVLSLVTAPNVLLNTTHRPAAESVDESTGTFEDVAPPDPTFGGRAHFYSGSWSTLSPLIAPGSYRVILTSETIYNISHHEDLLNLIEHALHPSGICLVAAKTNYFGLSGSIFTFSGEVEARGKLKASKVWSSDNEHNRGSGGVRREIWLLKWIR
ncbi:hypothetical protein M427DRAFT_93496 [Gonapodya prolifera JEL478]|uniref:protein-histidine N-methyltransferase n=1 Tax=Gonapodya prolifera (strain JEL478) TaxID=1344416 RepID=A0A139AYN9_GONPJ|nr:hypothetical protein M427DRAFT_93496 [Gonapodya prolifera JEL478]|eukprot:KXS21575.1 hypothetical protein M427DRAFT_93496 [Gonapodya prolifera JEL478]